MEWLIGLTLLVIACFTGVLLFGAPYLPTLTKQVEVALDLIDLKPGQTVLELGCGDGKVLIAAAERGLQAIGYELNPLLAAVAWLRTRRYDGKVKVICANFWSIQLPPSEGIFVFLLDKYMARLDTKIVQESPKPIKLISFAFQIPNKKPVMQKDGLFRYDYK